MRTGLVYDSWNLSHNINERMCDMEYENHTSPKNQLPFIALFYSRASPVVPIVTPDQGISLPKNLKAAIWYTMC